MGKKADKLRNTAAAFGIGVILGIVIIGMCVAVPSLKTFVKTAAGHGFWFFMAGWIGFMVLLAVAAFVQIVLHEAGRLVFGLMTGYRFVSFRIGSFVLVRDDKGYGLRRFSIAGTGGQCLLEPPSTLGETFPYRLYCMGGVAVNLLTAIAAYVAVLVADISPVWGLVFISLSISGFFIGLMNGIPMKVGGVPNDGHNLFFAGRTPEMLRALWLQLKVNALQTRGERLRDMPDEWFEVPSDADLSNYMYTAVAGMAASRLLEERRIGEAREMFRRIDEAGAGSVSVYRMEVACELLFIEIITGCDKAAERMFTPEIRRYADIYSRYMLSRVRLLYAYARFVEKDDAKAAALYERAVKMVAQSPSKGDAEAEMEMIEWVKGLAVCNS